MVFIRCARSSVLGYNAPQVVLLSFSYDLIWISGVAVLVSVTKSLHKMCARPICLEWYIRYCFLMLVFEHRVSLWLVFSLFFSSPFQHLSIVCNPFAIFLNILVIWDCEYHIWVLVVLTLYVTIFTLCSSCSWLV